MQELEFGGMLLQEYVLGETSLERFKAEYLDKKPALIKGANRLFEHVNMESVDDLLCANAGSIHAFTRVLLGSEDLMMHANPIFFSETQKAFVDKAFQRGATIKVEDFEMRHPLMSKLCRAFETVFGGDTYAMVFLTPPKQQGFGIHFDPVSSFITQLSGRKHWKIYPAWGPEFPTKTMSRPLADVPMPVPLIEAALDPGDMLYIPAGFPHEAICADAHSLHMTVGVGAHRPIEILQYALQELLEQHVELRQPVYPLEDDFKSRMEVARDTLARELAALDLDALIPKFHIAYNANRVNAQTRGLTNYAKACQLTKESLVRCVPDKPASVELRGDKIWLRASSTIRQGRPLLTSPPHIELPVSAEQETRQLIAAKEPVPVHQLEGLLATDSKVVLARRLAAMGVVEVVTPRRL